MEQLNEIVEYWKAGDMEKAVFRYSTLFNKRTIKEEVVHLKNLLSAQSKKERELWIQCFQELFENIINFGISLEEKSWFKVGIAKDNKRFEHRDYLIKNKIIALCHMKIMKEIYEESVYNYEFLPVSYLQMIMVICNNTYGISSSQFIWDFFYKKHITTTTLTNVVNQGSVLKAMLADSVTTVRNVNLSGANSHYECEMPVTGEFVECDVENILIKKTTFHEFFLKGTLLKNLTLLVCILEHVQIENCRISNCNFFAPSLKVTITNSIVGQTQIGNRNCKNPMKIARSYYNNVTFNTVTFWGLHCKKTIFHDVRFLHCTFNSCIGKEVQFIDCKMDQSTYDSFKQYNGELSRQVQIEILPEECATYLLD